MPLLTVVLSDSRWQAVEKISSGAGVSHERERIYLKEKVPKCALVHFCDLRGVYILSLRSLKMGGG